MFVKSRDTIFGLGFGQGVHNLAQSHQALVNVMSLCSSFGTPSQSYHSPIRPSPPWTEMTRASSPAHQRLCDSLSRVAPRHAIDCCADSNASPLLVDEPPPRPIRQRLEVTTISFKHRICKLPPLSTNESLLDVLLVHFQVRYPQQVFTSSTHALQPVKALSD
jgi:hypothetical protein